MQEKQVCERCDHCYSRAGKFMCRQRRFYVYTDDYEEYKILPFIVKNPSRCWCEDWTKRIPV